MKRRTALLILAVIAVLVGLVIAASDTETNGKHHTPLMTNQPPS